MISVQNINLSPQFKTTFPRRVAGLRHWRVLRELCAKHTHSYHRAAARLARRRKNRCHRAQPTLAASRQRAARQKRRAPVVPALCRRKSRPPAPPFNRFRRHSGKSAPAPELQNLTRNFAIGSIASTTHGRACKPAAHSRKIRKPRI